jgi:hypothetical protein
LREFGLHILVLVQENRCPETNIFVCRAVA